MCIDISFSWGVASLPVGKSRSVCGEAVCKLQALHGVLIISTKRTASLKVKGLKYSCLLIVHLPSKIN